MTGWRLQFGGFALDLATDRLWQGRHAVALSRRDLAVLRCLVVRSGQLLSTDEILESVWGDLFVTRGVVKVSIRRVRTALADTAEQPRFIETVGRKGYRFIAAVERELGGGERAPATQADGGVVLGRDAELATLLASLDRARLGRRQTVFVAGEAAAERTALVDALLAGVAGSGEFLCAVGRCVGQIGPREPYRALFEAIRSLCRGPLATEVLTVLRRHAPLWLTQLPDLLSPVAREALTRETVGATRERMVREIADAIDAITSLSPLVLVLEDLHESDPGTLDVLSVVATRRDDARLLVLAAFEPGDRRDLGLVLGRLLERGMAEMLTVSPIAPPAREASAVASEGHESHRARVARAPFVGRDDERARLAQCFESARSGTGGLALVMGEPGIGKTRLIEEIAAEAETAGAQLLRGRCRSGELGRPYGPLAEALAAYSQSCDEAALREDVGVFGGIVAKIAPELRARLPDLPEPANLTPEEERHRLLDAVAQLLWGVSRRMPVVLVLDDLHWADGGTLALLRHLARFLPRHRVLILGAYRDVELGPEHPLADALASIGRELDVERVPLAGLDRGAVSTLVRALAGDPIPTELVEAIAFETAGNPFFVREVLLHLLEEGTLECDRGGVPWRRSLEEAGVPEGVREVIGRRLARLSEETNRLLIAASGCTGGFRFDVVAAVADLEERSALNALDAALEAQLVRATGEPDAYEFTHALIRHSLYSDLSPSRRVRLHRRLAREIGRRAGQEVAQRAIEIAEHWHRSAALPGAEQGVPYCLVAADRAERAAAHEEAATALRMALDLAPPRDPRRPRLLARLGLALAWSLSHDEAVAVASEAGALLAASEGSDAAADYLADAAEAVYSSTFDPRAWPLAEHGLRYVGERRDLTWARLAALDLDRRDASDPGFPGVPLDVAARHDVSRVLVANWSSLVERGVVFYVAATVFRSREDAIERGRDMPAILGFWAGEYEQALDVCNALLVRLLARGQLAAASLILLSIARFQLARGDAAASRESHARAVALVDRLGNPPFLALQMGGIPLELAGFLGEGHERLLPGVEHLLTHATPENRWIEAMLRAASALYYAHAGRGEEALRAIGAVLPAIERAPGWAANYTAIVWLAIEAIWVLGSAKFADVLERNLRAKTLAPDFRYAHTDARLALARLCALTGRFEEARTWFGEARRVLEEQSARPLRAIADFDEAWMEMRRGPAADRDRARSLLAAARDPFASLGMPGWIRRAEALMRDLERVDDVGTGAPSPSRA